VEIDLIARLKAVAGVSALVSTRIYGGRVPQSAIYPLIRIQRIGSDHAQDTSGASGLCQALMQIDCFGKLVADAKSVAEQVRLALQGWRGTQGSTNFRSILLTDQRDLDEHDQQGGELGFYGVSMDFTVSFVESIPSF
jgi:hypothetical protein